MGSVGSGDPMRQTQVSQQMVALGEELEVLSGVLNDLQGRLGGVMSSLSTAKEAAPPVPQPTLCDHAEAIRREAGKVESLVGQVRSMYNRLEV